MFPSPAISSTLLPPELLCLSLSLFLLSIPFCHSHSRVGGRTSTARKARMALAHIGMSAKSDFKLFLNVLFLHFTNHFNLFFLPRAFFPFRALVVLYIMSTINTQKTAVSLPFFSEIALCLSELRVQTYCSMNHTRVNAPPQVPSATHAVQKRGALFSSSPIQPSSPLGWWHFVKCAWLWKRRSE